MANKITSLIRAKIISLVAAIIIEILLIGMLFTRSIFIIFSYPVNISLLLLVILGVGAYISYVRGLNHSRIIMLRTSPLSLILASLALPAYYLINPILSPSLVVLAYFVEAYVGIHLYKELRSYSDTSAKIFIIGMSLFVFSLPLVIISIELIILPIIGNILKSLGLVGLMKSLLGGLHDYSSTHIGYWEKK